MVSNDSKLKAHNSSSIDNGVKAEMIIILLGPPGAGKGTQSEILERQLRLVHVSSGDLLREHRAKGTELGKVADGYMSEGELVPDNLVIEMIVDRISAPDVERGVLLDGFPRTLPQAVALDKALEVKRKRVNSALYINVPNEILIDRLTGRWTCRKNPKHIYHERYSPPKTPGVCAICGGELYQRDDDKYDKVVKRQQEYFEKTLPIIQYYRDQHILCEVNGDKPVETVTQDLLGCLR